MNLMIDLCSGLGGASDGFLRPNWTVQRYENNPLLGDIPFTTLCDLMTYEVKVEQPPKLVWASPPCTEFSRGFNAPAPTAQREGREFQPSLELTKRCIEIIQRLESEFWVIENVVGAIPHF